MLNYHRYPILLITLFNVADLVGKTLPAAPTLLTASPMAILWQAAARSVFVPVFYVAALLRSGAAVFAFLTLALGTSNGYVTSCAFMAASRGLQGLEAELAGNLALFALTCGLCLGAACSFLWLL